MSQEDYPVDFVLDSLETIMTPSKQPKVILFDIGGVCVGDTSSGYPDDPKPKFIIIEIGFL
jgi:hypothetical protein